VASFFRTQCSYLPIGAAESGCGGMFFFLFNAVWTLEFTLQSFRTKNCWVLLYIDRVFVTFPADRVSLVLIGRLAAVATIKRLCQSISPGAHVVSSHRLPRDVTVGQIPGNMLSRGVRITKISASHASTIPSTVRSVVIALVPCITNGQITLTKGRIAILSTFAAACSRVRILCIFQI